MPPSQYLLKNISRNDINLGDLRYRIPAGKTRDLLGKNARLSWFDIQESIKSGSISKRLGKSLIEVNAIIEPKLPLMQDSARVDEINPNIIVFPQRTKSYIVVEVGKLDETASILEDEEFLKELETDSLLHEDLPIVAKDEKES